MSELNAIFELINPDNTVSINRYLIHSLGLKATVLYKPTFEAFFVKAPYTTHKGIRFALTRIPDAKKL